MMTITAIIRAQPGHADTVRRALLAVIESVRRDEPDTINYYVSQSADDPNLFTTFERFRDQAERQRIKAVLGSQHARGEGGFIIAGQYRNGGLRDDGAGVGLVPHVVNGAAVQPHAGLERALVGIEARKGGQQSGMDVDHAAPPS